MTGQRLGHYQITVQIGSGGMGEVYCARDTKLQREVAVKVLPRSFASDPDRLVRFEQEARTLASLNHPGILVIHESGIHDGSPYLVSELLEGQTLRDLLKSGPLPPRKAAEYAIQVAQALAAAHNKGIIHRDLKPENLFITQDDRVKVLDFGLAKLKALSSSKNLPASAQPTIINPTEPGMVLGTPGYMSPEQARGVEAELRSDIFSLGAILYEMLCGQRAFPGETSVESMHAILTAEPPDLFEQVQHLPPALERVVRRCLEKRPEQRFQTAADLAFALENSISSGGSSEARQELAQPQQIRFARLLPWLAALIGICVGVYGLFLAWRASHGAVAAALPTPILRKIEISVPPPTNLPMSPVVESLAISPDGKKLVYGNADGLWLRHLDDASPPVLLATPRLPQNKGKPLTSPFWSPNSEDIGYFDTAEICRVSAAGGVPRLISSSTSYAGIGRRLGGAWLPDNRILFPSFGASLAHGLYEVSADGGEPVLALALDKDEYEFQNISALPGGRGVLLIVNRTNAPGVDTMAVWTGKGEKKVLFQLPNSVLGQSCYTASGHIVLERLDGPGGIWAFPFSLETLERTGEMFRVAETGSLPSTSADGTLAYSPTEAIRSAARQMVWVDRTGKIVAAVGSPMDSLRAVGLSPDEHRIAAISSGVGGNDALWVFDTAGGNSMPVTNSLKLQNIQNALWFPDGSQLLISGVGSGAGDTFTLPVDGFAAGQRIMEGAVREFSRSGKYLFVRARQSLVHGPAAPSGNGSSGLVWAWAEMAGKDTKLQPFPEGLNPQDVALSPDDSLLAYSSDETGQNEVFVVSFPGFTNKNRISTSGGARMQWRPDGSELYYLTGDRQQLWSASIKHDGGLQIAAAAKVCDLPRSTYSSAAAPATTLFQVTADAKRFLMLQTPPQPADAPSSNPPKAGALLVENWFEEFHGKK